MEGVLLHAVVERNPCHSNTRSQHQRGGKNSSVRRKGRTELHFDAEPGGQVDEPREGAGGQGRQVAAERDLLQIGGRICCAPSGQNGEPNAIYER